MDIENVEIWKGIPITHAVCEVHWGNLQDFKVLRLLNFMLNILKKKPCLSLRKMNSKKAVKSM